jgi:hypothetical protein
MMAPTVQDRIRNRHVARQKACEHARKIVVDGADAPTRVRRHPNLICVAIAARCAARAAQITFARVA